MEGRERSLGRPMEGRGRSLGRPMEDRWKADGRPMEGRWKADGRFGRVHHRGRHHSGGPRRVGLLGTRGLGRSLRVIRVVADPELRAWPREIGRDQWRAGATSDGDRWTAGATSDDIGERRRDRTCEYCPSLVTTSRHQLSPARRGSKSVGQKRLSTSAPSLLLRTWSYREALVGCS